jgi:hypothetical protein
VRSSVASICVAVLAVLAGSAVAAPAARATACPAAGYAYAGLEGWDAARGVAATITTVETPSVAAGHVAAWVGIGAAGGGPDGSDLWLQAGIDAKPGRAAHLYYEFVSGERPARYVELGRAVRPGTSHRVAVIEVAGRPTWWRVWVDGHPVSAALHLPGRRTWEPTATSESWDGGTGACNAFAFRFTGLRLTAGTGSWLPWLHASTLRDAGTWLRRAGRSEFVASTTA